MTVPNKAVLLQDLKSRMRRGGGFSVATLNLDHVVKLGRDPAFRAAYAAQTHVTADGNPIVWLERLSGQREISLVPGSELIEPLAALAAETGMPLGLFGATETSLWTAAGLLKARHPDLEIAYVGAPPMGFDPDGAEADQAIAAIAESGARVVFLALGAPRQERFAARARQALPAIGFLSVGAGLDFLSGTQTRAPLWVQALAMEWLWRMVSDPSRLVIRYVNCFVALPGLTWRALCERRNRRQIE